MPTGVFIRTKRMKENIRKALKGRTYEDIYGKDYAEIKKQKSSETMRKTNQRFKSIFPTNKLERVKRFCFCGCNESFVCKVNSKRRFINGHNINMYTPEQRSRWMSGLWKNTEYAQKVLKAQKKGWKVPQNKKEKLLGELLGKDYKFVGNKAVFFDRFNPDFINVNGQKKLVELFGTYWHSKTQARDIRRLETFARHGYGTLIVWEKELEDLPKLKKKLINWEKVKV